MNSNISKIVVPSSGEPGYTLYNIKDNNAIPSSEKGAASGVATLDEDGHLTSGQIQAEYPDLVAGNIVGEFSDANAEFAYRPSAGAVDIESGYKVDHGGHLEAIKGNTVAWNQIMLATNYPEGVGGASIQALTNGFRATYTGQVLQVMFYNLSMVEGHKYLFYTYLSNITGNPIQSEIVIYKNPSGIDSRAQWYPTNGNSACIFSLSSTAFTDRINVQIASSTADFSVDFNNVMLIDLTLIYGAGNEPTTVAQFESDYMKWFGKPLTYEEYDEGSLKPVKMEGIKTVGFNQWDEEWEKGYFYQGPNGELINPTNTSTCIRSKNLIPVIPGQTYYCITSKDGGKIYRVASFDANGDYIKDSLIGSNDSSLTFTVSSKTKFIKFHTESYGTTYNNDICINLHHSGDKDGEYEPYWTSTLNVPIKTMTGKLIDSETGEITGNSVTVFPDGMKKAGTVYDEIVKVGSVTKAIKRVGSININTLNWTYDSTNVIFTALNFQGKQPSDNNTLINVTTPNYYTVSYRDKGTNKTISGTWVDAQYHYLYIKDESYSDTETFKTALSGVILYYELAEPEEYILDDFELPQEYDVDDWGTEEILLGTNGVAPVLDLKYGINAGDTIKNLPHNYVSAVSEQNFTDAQKARARHNIGAEDVNNKVTSISSSSTDIEYPSAKCVYE